MSDEDLTPLNYDCCPRCDARLPIAIWHPADGREFADCPGCYARWWRTPPPQQEPCADYRASYDDVCDRHRPFVPLPDAPALERLGARNAALEEAAREVDAVHPSSDAAARIRALKGKPPA